MTYSRNLEYFAKLRILLQALSSRASNSSLILSLLQYEHCRQKVFFGNFFFFFELKYKKFDDDCFKLFFSYLFILQLFFIVVAT